MNFREILKNYPHTVELHAHTNPASPCGDFPANEVVDFYRAAGVTSLAITNHFTHELIGDNIKDGVKKYLEDYHLAKESAISRPIFFPAPVTNAVRPSNIFILSLRNFS